MTTPADQYLKPIDRLDELVLHDLLTWHSAIQDLREDNAKLGQIIAELLSKNQYLRCSLESIASADELSAIQQMWTDRA